MWSSNGSCCCRKRSTPLSKLKTAEGPQQKSRVLIWSVGVLCAIKECLPVSCHLPLSSDLWHNHHGYVLEQILLGEPTEVVVESIHEYLMSISEQVQNGTTKLEDFNVFKVSKLSQSSWREFLNTATHQCLGKNPKDYPDVKSQPHVQVALRMKQQGGSTCAGDIIPYVFCLAEGKETAKTTQANQAKHPDEVQRAGLELRVGGQPLFSSIPAVYWRELDYKHYLLQQLLPPIKCLCDPIEGTLVPTLFTFLLCIDTEFDASHSTGLDPQRYKTSNGPEERDFSMLDLLISNKEQLQDPFPFVVWCRYCSVHMPFTPIPERSVSIYPVFPLISFKPEHTDVYPPPKQSCLPGVPKTTQTEKHAAAAWSENQGVYWTVLWRLDGM